MSVDRAARAALRDWRTDPSPANAQRLCYAWERAGLFGDREPTPGPAPRTISRGANAVETRYTNGATLHSYGVLVAVIAPDFPGVLWSPEAAYSRTSKKHVRQWAEGLTLTAVQSPEELAQIAQRLV